VPTSPDDPATEKNRAAWGQLMAWKKPLLTCFSDSDPITKYGDLVLQKLIPGAKGQPHVEIKQAGHFVQEDKGEEWAKLIVEFIQKN
jgi:haloalkane dehalogenase